MICGSTPAAMFGKKGNLSREMEEDEVTVFGTELGRRNQRNIVPRQKSLGPPVFGEMTLWITRDSRRRPEKKRLIFCLISASSV